MASTTNRLTYLFYCSSLTTPDKVTYLTSFPFIFDEEMAIPRSLRQSDVDNKFGGEFPDESQIQSYGNYNSNSWFIGLAINGQIIYDGLHRSQQNQGIEATIEKKANGGSIGKVVVDRKVFNTEIGIADAVEIVAMSATVYTPWIYYGLIPKRQEIAQILGRNSSGMGGIPNGMIPAQAIGMKYFVNSTFSTDPQEVIPPFPSVFLPLFGSATTGAVKDHYLMADVLDGDGSVAWRSSVSFSTIDMGMIDSVAGFSVPLFNIMRSDNYKHIDYRSLEVQTKTYEENPHLVTGTTFFLAIEVQKTSDNIYSRLSDFFRSVLFKFIDFDTCKFYIIKFVREKSSSYQYTISSSNSLINSESFCKELESCQIDEAAVDTTLDLTEVLNFVREKATKVIEAEGPNRKYRCAILSRFKFDNTNNYASSVSSKQAVLSFSDGLVNKIPILFHAGVILVGDSQSENDRPQQTDPNEQKFLTTKDLAKVVCSKCTGIPMQYDSSAYGFQLLSIFASLSDNSMKESTMLMKNSGVDANIIRKQVQTLLSMPSNIVPNDRDYDGDSNVTMVDRLYYLYDSYSPNSSSFADPFYSAWLDPGAEMRYWRKICPIGLLYRIDGRVVSIQSKRSSNTLLEVEIVWKNDQGVEIPYSSTDIKNRIWVYVENGTNSNITNYSIASNGILEFQGRLLVPSYLKSLRLGTAIRLNNPDDFSAWYRVRRSTSEDLLDWSTSMPQGEPILVVRTNMDVSSSDLADTNEMIVPSIFASSAIPEAAFYRISQLTEAVEDHVYYGGSLTHSVTPHISDSTPSSIFQTKDRSPYPEVLFQTVEFDISIDENIDPSARGGFLYDLRYRKNGDNNYYQLWKFWSAEITSQGLSKGAYKINLSNNKTFVCQLNFSDSTKANRLLNIDFPFSTGDPNTRCSFKWDVRDWKIVAVRKNGKKIPALIQDGDSFIDNGISAGGCKVSPSLAQILMKDKIDQNKDVITIELKNIAGDLSSVKKGWELSLSLVQEPGGLSRPRPSFANIQVNRSSNSKSIERVDCFHSSDLYGENFHLMSPTYGFLSADGNHGWYFSQDDSNSLSGGSMGADMVGDLISPYVYIDAFADGSNSIGLSDKLLREGSEAYSLPSISIVYSTLTNSAGRPFFQVRSMGYQAPQPPEMLHIATCHSNYSDRFTLLYKMNNSLQEKYSFTKFEDRDTSVGFPYARRSLRDNIPIYAGVPVFERLFYGNEEPVEIDIQSVPNKILMALEVVTEGVTDIDDTSQPFKLLGMKATGYENLGYTDSKGNVSSKWFSVYSNKNDYFNKKGYSYFQIPDISGVSKIKIMKPDEESEVGNIVEVDGFFVDSLVDGNTPQLCETSYGEYLLFFTRKSGQTVQLFCLISTDDAQMWHRPSVDATKDTFSKPIPILSKYSNPQIIRNPENDDIYIFVHDDTLAYLQLVVMPRVLINKVSKGMGEVVQELNTETSDSDGSLSDIAQNDEVDSWEQVFVDKNTSKIKHISTVFKSASNLYSAALSSNSNIFIAFMTSGGAFQIKYVELSPNSDYQPENWHDFGIDLFHADSYLSKVFEKADIQSVTLSINDSMEIINIFFAVSGRLFMYNLPVVASEKRISINDNSDAQKDYQNLVNGRKPILVVGQSNGLNPQYVSINGKIDEEFVSQIISVEWMEDGSCWLFYVGSDQTVKCLVSNTGGELWSSYNNV